MAAVQGAALSGNHPHGAAASVAHTGDLSAPGLDNPVFVCQLPAHNGLGLPEVFQAQLHIHRRICLIVSAVAEPGEQDAADLHIVQIQRDGGFSGGGGFHHRLDGTVRVDDLNLLHFNGIARQLDSGDPGIPSITVGEIPVRVLAASSAYQLSTG